MKKAKRKPRRVHCPHCGGHGILRHSSYIYGDDNITGGDMYVCSNYPQCNSYIKADPKTLEPLGTMADSELRHLRIEAHRSFDQLWKQGIMTRSNAYRWMAERYGMDKNGQAHIRNFSTYLCQSLIDDCDAALAANRERAS